MQKVRILVVEDETIVSLDIQRRLKTLGYEVAGASVSGEDAIYKAATHRPDLVLMDLQLPGIDGAEALRQIREADETQIPVVAVTAFAMNDDRERAFASGFDGYVEKPISVRALPQQVRDFLRLRGTA